MRASTPVTLAALAATLLALGASAASPRAQAAPARTGGEWVEFAPEGEGFAARMPAQPTSRAKRAEAGVLKVEGRRYAVYGEGGAAYFVWVLDDPKNVGARLSAAKYVSERFRGEALYLDEIAELAWELLVAPDYERIRRENPGDFQAGMDYQREFELGGYPAREYFVALGKARGPAYVCAVGPRIYVVAALGAERQAAQLKRFVESFRLKAPARQAVALLEGVGVGPGSGYGPGRGGDPSKSGGGGVDYTRPFLQREVTRKAIITDKPEQGYTESARKFNVTGVVRIRAILGSNGQVTGVTVVKGLPHGLTTKAVDALRHVKFQPAQKDGRVVSQYVTFEYNFNIY